MNLLEMKKQIEQDKIKKNKIEGLIEQLLSELKEQYGSSTISEALKKLQEQEDQIKKEKKIIINKTKELENKYDWE